MHKCSKRQQESQIPGNYDRFFQVFCGVLSRIVILCALHTRSDFFILLQRGIVIFDCEAAALPGRFLPELGRSSERPFFCAGLLRSEGVAGSLMGCKPTSLPAPAQIAKSLAQNGARCVARERLVHIARGSWRAHKMRAQNRYGTMEIIPRLRGGSPGGRVVTAESLSGSASRG